MESLGIGLSGLMPFGRRYPPRAGAWRPGRASQAMMIEKAKNTQGLQSSSFLGSVLESLTKKEDTPKKELLWSPWVRIIVYTSSYDNKGSSHNDNNLY